MSKSWSWARSPFALLLLLLAGGAGGQGADSGLAETLERYANGRRQIAISFTNSGYMHFAINWLHHVREVGVENYLIFALDEEALSALREQGANVFYDPALDEGKIDKSVTDFGSQGFKKIVHLKPLLTSRVLEHGYEVLVSDSDVVFLVNPFEREDVTDSALGIMSDAHYGYGMGSTPYFVNSGFAYMKPTEETRLFVREVLRLLESRPDKMDQDAYNTAISNWERRFAGVPLVLSIMDPAKVCNGWVYFMRQLGQRTDADMIAVHNNWADGQGGSTNVQKVFRFREHLLWAADGDEHTRSEKKYLTYTHAEADGPVSLWGEIEGLRSALSIAQVLGRVLVLPDFRCSVLEVDWEADVRCTADSFLDVQALLKIFPHTRESSFMENPSVSLEDVSPTRIIRIATEEELRTHPAGGGEGVLTPRGGHKGLSEGEIRSALEPFANAPVLAFRGMVHRFRGFDHPVTQLYFDKNFRKGVAESFYVREGANRIQMMHVPSHCTGVVLTEECALSERCVQATASALGKLLQAGRSGEGGAPSIKTGCAFVAAHVSDRRSASLGAALRPLGTVFKEVVHMGEGQFDFPISDLWRMGKHHMVTWMQTSIVASLDNCIVVVPQEGKAASPLTERLLLIRAFEYDVPAYMLDSEKESLVKFEGGRVKCPAPDYTDNRMLKDVGVEHQNEFRRLGVAAACFKEAAEKDKSDLQSWQLLGNVELSRNRLDASAAAYDQANRLTTDSGQLINMGVAMQRAGKVKEAVEAYEKALKVDETRHEAHHNLASCLQELGRHDEALSHFSRAIEILPTFTLAYTSKGSLLHARGQHKESVEAFMGALKTDAQDKQSYLDLGQVLHTLGDYEEEQRVYKAALDNIPDLAVAYSYWATSILADYQRKIGYRSYGKIAEDQIPLGQAEALYHSALEKDPTCGMCHGQLADMYKDSHRINKAVEHYSLSAKFLPHLPTIFCNLVYTKMFACDWSNYSEDFGRLMALVERETSQQHPPQYMCVQPLQGNLYRPLSAPLLKKVTETYVAKLLQSYGGVRKVTLPAEVHMPALDGRLRIGYLSADFKDHPVAKRMQDIFAMHDRSRVRVTCYCLNAHDRSTWRVKIQRDAERFHELQQVLQTQGVHAIASHIAADHTDVLINLAGHTRGNDDVTMVLAMQPAPVQLMHEGYAGTMGGGRHTAHVTDRVSSPPEFQGHYVEKLLYMPNCFFVNDHAQTYAELAHDFVDDQERAKRLAYGHLRPDLKFLMGAFNQLHKIDPGIFSTWMQTMREVPDAHIWLIKIHSKDPEENLKRVAQESGVDPSRLHVVQGYNEREHLYVKAAAHIFLDTPSYNAHSSGCDVIWAGLPLVTVAGDKMASRVAASLVLTLGCAHTIVRTEGDYADVVRTLGTGRDALGRVRECVRERKVASPLFDTRGWVADQERALRMAAEVSWAHVGKDGAPGARDMHVVVSRL